MAHHEIFRQQLAFAYPALGHALWEPGPEGECGPVKIGDVGYVREGTFYRLFNALLPADDASHEGIPLPEYHEPLIPDIHHVSSGTLKPNHYCSAGVNVVSADPILPATRSDVFPQVKFSCTRRRGGAILSLPVEAHSWDTRARGDCGEWMLKHIDRWFSFARGLGLGIDHMEEIILVTGYHSTRSWANVAFLEGRANAEASFGVNVVHGRDVSITWQFPFTGIRGAVCGWGPEGENLQETQCVFIRGFRAIRVLGPDKNLVLNSYNKSRDPLHVLMEYIVARTSECDMVLVHDDDLARVGFCDSKESLQPAGLMGYLQSSQPEIQQVLCDWSSANEKTSAGPTMVAMFSKEFYGWNLAVPSSPSTMTTSQDKHSSYHSGSSVTALGTPAGDLSTGDLGPTSHLRPNLSLDFGLPRIESIHSLDLSAVLHEFPTPPPYIRGDGIAESPAAQPEIDLTNQLHSQVHDISSCPAVSADTEHQYNLKSRGRDYALITVKSHALNAHDPPLLYFGEVLKGFVVLSLNDLGEVRSIDVVLRMLHSDPIRPSFETKCVLLPQQLDDSHRISGGRCCWPFAITPTTPSVLSSDSSSTTGSSLGQRSLRSYGAVADPTLQLVVTIHRRGPLTQNVGIKQKICYVPSPDPSVRSSPSPISVDVPYGFPAGSSWPEQIFPLVTARGVIFRQDHVEVECSLVTPSSYPISDTIPLHLILTSKSREALALFGMPHVVDVRLQKVLVFGKQASSIQPLTLKNRGSYHRMDLAAKAQWEPEGHAEELPSSDGHSRPRWRIKLNGRLQREARVELSPSFEEPGMALVYFVGLFPFRSRDFRPANSTKKALVMGKIQLTKPR